MERGEAQLFGIASLVVGVVLISIPWRLMRSRPRATTLLVTLAAVMILGLLVFVFGFFYSWYAFNPDAGR